MSEQDGPREIESALRKVEGLSVRRDVELGNLTRFGIGGPADVLAETDQPEAFAAAVKLCRRCGVPLYILGDGTNVIVSDAGYRGVVLRFTAVSIEQEGEQLVSDAGAALEALVDAAIEASLKGLETLARIPGSVGAAVYGNAGAYGHSIRESVAWVRFFDGEQVREIDNAGCEFVYRGSVFKRNKAWMIFRCGLVLQRAERDELRKRADEITAIRDEKFPPSMRCAGSIFKNLYLKDLPAGVAAQIPERAVREGKVATAYFLDQVGARGMRRGGITIADYHANLIYNDGGGTALELRSLIDELKQRIADRYGFAVEEEVQYVGDLDRNDR